MKPSYSYQWGRFLGRVIFGSVGSPKHGLERVPNAGPLLIVSNHQSFLDPLFVSTAFPQRFVHFMAKEELFASPTSKHMMLGLGAFPVNRNGPSKSTLNHVLTLLRQEQCVCLFAEGTRSKNGELGQFQSGFARIAKKTKATVVPVALHRTRELFEDIQGPALPLWSKVIGRQPPSLRIGQPISHELDAEEIARQTEKAVQELFEECRRA